MTDETRQPDREAAHTYLAQAKAILDFVLVHADDDGFGDASPACVATALDGAASLIEIADREFRQAA